MFEEADKIKVLDFEGWYDRGEEDSVLPPYLVSAQNVIYEDKEVKTREGISLDKTYSNLNGASTIVKFLKNPTEIIYVFSDATNIRRQDTDATILTGTGGTPAIRGLTAFGRAYFIVNLSNSTTAYLYVWTGTGNARKACGSAPTGATLAAVTSGAGKIERGTHVFKVCFETDTGFITPPGNTQFVAYVAAAGDSVDFSGIPTGPAGTSKRHIIATRAILNYNNDHVNQEYFFVPNGTINDNTTTVLNNIDFYDADLVDSADFTLNQLSEVNAVPSAQNEGIWQTAPGGWGVTLYNKRLVVWKDGILYISNPDEPESFDSLHGTVEIDDSTGHITDVADLRGSLYIYTETKTYITTDNGDFPDTWEVVCVDHSNGALDAGVAAAYEQSGNTIDYLVVANRNGIMLFTGVFQSELTEKIRDKWRAQTIPPTYGGSRLAIDHHLKRIYAFYSEDAADITRYIICGDYSRGLTPDKIRWSKWIFTSASSTRPNKVFQLWTEWLAGSAPKFKFIMHDSAGSLKSQLKLDSGVSDDASNVINTFVEILFDPQNNAVNHFIGFLARISGVGTLLSTVYNTDRVSNTALANKFLSGTPGKEIVIKSNTKSEKVILKVGTNGSTERFSLRGITGFFHKLWVRS